MLKKGKVGGLEGGPEAPGGKNWNKRREGMKCGAIPIKGGPGLEKKNEEELLQELKTLCGEKRFEGNSKNVDGEDSGVKASAKDCLVAEEREIILKVDDAVVQASKPAIYIFDLGKATAGASNSDTTKDVDEQKNRSTSQKWDNVETPIQIMKYSENKTETKGNGYNEEQPKIVGKLEKTKIDKESEGNNVSSEEACVGFSTSPSENEKNSMEITSKKDIESRKMLNCKTTAGKDLPKIGSKVIDASSEDVGKDLDHNIDTTEQSNEAELLTRNGKLLNKSLLQEADPIISNTVPASREGPILLEHRVLPRASKEAKLPNETEKGKEKEKDMDKEEQMGLLEHKLVLEGAREAQLSNELDRMKRSRKTAMSQVLFIYPKKGHRKPF